MPLSWKGRLFLALLGMVLWSQAGMSAKIERFTDKEGTVHISNAGEAEPGKPGTAPPETPIGTLPPGQLFPAAPPPAPPAPVMPSPAEPPEMSANEGESSTEPPAAEAGGEAQPVPPPGQGMEAQ